MNRIPIPPKDQCAKIEDVKKWMENCCIGIDKIDEDAIYRGSVEVYTDREVIFNEELDQIVLAIKPVRIEAANDRIKFVFAY